MSGRYYTQFIDAKMQQDLFLPFWQAQTLEIQLQGSDIWRNIFILNLTVLKNTLDHPTVDLLH